MATRLYGVSRGDNFGVEVTEGVGPATSADNIELIVDLAVGLEKGEVLRALKSFEAHILENGWPPS